MLVTTQTTARFGHLLVTVATSQYGDVPRTIAFTAPVQLSENDLWAALWHAAGAGEDRADLEDLDYVREIVADAIVNSGLEALDTARGEIAALRPGTADHRWALELREIVRRAFDLVLPVPTPRRELEGVSA
jgi:hypothetical protein